MCGKLPDDLPAVGVACQADERFRRHASIQVDLVVSRKLPPSGLAGSGQIMMPHKELSIWIIYSRLELLHKAGDPFFLRKLFHQFRLQCFRCLMDRLAVGEEIAVFEDVALYQAEVGVYNRAACYIPVNLPDDGLNAD